MRSLPALLALIVLLGACGSDSETTAPTDAPETTSAPADSTPPDSTTGPATEWVLPTEDEIASILEAAWETAPDDVRRLASPGVTVPCLGGAVWSSVPADSQQGLIAVTGQLEDTAEVELFAMSTESMDAILSDLREDGACENDIFASTVEPLADGASLHVRFRFTSGGTGHTLYVAGENQLLRVFVSNSFRSGGDAHTALMEAVIGG